MIVSLRNRAIPIQFSIDGMRVCMQVSIIKCWPFLPYRTTLERSCCRT
jgi:hypothetical protein